MSEDPTYDSTSEAYLAAVWYAMVSAKEAHQRDHRAIKGGRLARMGYLRQQQKALGFRPIAGVSYSRMRAELAEFADQFGRSL